MVNDQLKRNPGVFFDLKRCTASNLKSSIVNVASVEVLTTPTNYKLLCLILSNQGKGYKKIHAFISTTCTIWGLTLSEGDVSLALEHLGH